MIHSIKNLTDKELIFDKISVLAEETKEIKWQKTTVTYVAYSELVIAYNAGEIDFFNAKGKSVKRVKKKSLTVLETKNGKQKQVKKSRDFEVALFKFNKQFNEMMNGYHQQL